MRLGKLLLLNLIAGAEEYRPNRVDAHNHKCVVRRLGRNIDILYVGCYPSPLTDMFSSPIGFKSYKQANKAVYILYGLLRRGGYDVEMVISDKNQHLISAR